MTCWFFHQWTKLYLTHTSAGPYRTTILHYKKWCKRCSKTKYYQDEY